MKKISLTQNKFTVVDDEDYEYLNQWKWCSKDYISTFYAGRKQDSHTTILMHRVIMDCPSNKYVDHIDGDGLNNQKSNLRVCSNSENGRNRGKQSNNKSGYKGVSIHNRGNKFRAQIKAEGKLIHLGVFETAEDAAKVYDQKALELHGEFSVLNFPIER